MRPDWDEYFMSIARVVATRSTCLRRSVGCVLVDDRHHILATGYNGSGSGTPHCNHELSIRHPCTEDTIEHPHACEGAKAESGKDLDKCNAIHAEQNALLQCSDTNSITAIYVTTSPCSHCMKMLLSTSCTRIVYVEPYDNEAISKIWIDQKRQLVRLKKS